MLASQSTPLPPLSSCIPITTSGASGKSFFAFSVAFLLSFSFGALPPVSCARALLNG